MLKILKTTILTAMVVASQLASANPSKLDIYCEANGTQRGPFPTELFFIIKNGTFEYGLHYLHDGNPSTPWPPFAPSTKGLVEFTEARSGELYINSGNNHITYAGTFVFDKEQGLTVQFSDEENPIRYPNCHIN